MPTKIRHHQLKKSWLALASILSLAGSGSSFAQTGDIPYAPPPPTSSLTVQAVSDLAKPASGKPFVVTMFKDDAREEKPEDWPATFMGSFVTPQGISICTATFSVGSRTLLTAAHCVAPDRKMTIRRGGDRWTATCQAHSAYSPTWDAGCNTAGNCPTSADYALCFIELGQGEFAPNFPRHERLNTDPAAVGVGGVLKLLGFGCTETTQTGGSSLSKEVLSSGWARV